MPIAFGSMTWHGPATGHDIDDSLPGNVRKVLNEDSAISKGQAGVADRQEHDRLGGEPRGPFALTGVDPNVCRGRASAPCFFIHADIIACAANMPLRGKILANSVATVVFLQVGFAVGSGLTQQTDFLMAGSARRLPATCPCSVSCWAPRSIRFLQMPGPHRRCGPSRTVKTTKGALKVPAWPARFMIVFGIC